MFLIKVPSSFFTFLSFILFSSNAMEEYSHQQYDSSKSTVRILAVDGGGLRGAIPIGILNRIEISLSAEFNTPVHLADYFDVFAGTSTGALIALGLAATNDAGEHYTANEIKQLYKDSGPNLFPRIKAKKIRQLFSTPYDPEPLARGLRQYFSFQEKEKLLSELQCHVIVPAYELQANLAYIFDSREALIDKSKDFSLIKVALSTTAAPTHIESHEFQDISTQDTKVFADGGLFANNPAWEALSRSLEQYPKATKFTLVSLGTGVSPKGDNSDLSSKGKLGWATKVFPIASGSAAALVEDNIERQRRILGKFGIEIEYIRIQCSIPEKLKDMTNADNLDALFALGWKTYETELVRGLLEKMREYFIKTKGLTQNKLENPVKEQLKLILRNQIGKDQLDFSGILGTHSLVSIKEILKEYPSKTEATCLNLSSNKILHENIANLIDLLKEYPQFTEIIFDNCDLGEDVLKIFVNLISTNKIPLSSLSFSAVNFEDSKLNHIVKLLNSMSNDFNLYLGQDVSDLLEKMDITTKRALEDPRIKIGNRQPSSIIKKSRKDNAEKEAIEEFKVSKKSHPLPLKVNTGSSSEKKEKRAKKDKKKSLKASDTEVFEKTSSYWSAESTNVPSSTMSIIKLNTKEKIRERKGNGEGCQEDNAEEKHKKKDI